MLKSLIAIGLLALAIWTNREQIRDVQSRGADLWRVLMAFGFFLGGLLLAFLRWFILVRAQGLPFRIRDALRLGFIGALFNLVIPGAVGGDFVKAAYLCGEQGKRTGPIASVVIDRLLGLLGLFSLAGVAGTVAWSTLDEPVRDLVTWSWGFFAVATLILAISFLPPRRPRTTKLGIELAAVGNAYRTHYWVLPLGIAMGALTHTLNVLAFWSLGLAIFPAGVPPWTEHLLIVPLVLFSTAVPLPFGALGVSEHVSDHLFQLAGYRGGAVTMMAFRLLLLGGAILGALVYFANPSQVQSLRDRARRLDEELTEQRIRTDSVDPEPETILTESSR